MVDVEMYKLTLLGSRLLWSYLANKNTPGATKRDRCLFIGDEAIVFET